jgi:transglutaminase-like putative cysteine protease
MRFRDRLSLAVMLCGALAPVAVFAQFQAPTQEELKMTSDPKAPGADAVYLYRDETDEDNQQHFREIYVRMKVLTEKGKELATVHFFYEPKRIPNEIRADQSDDGEVDASGWNSLKGHVEVAAISGRTIHVDGTIVPLTTTPEELMVAKDGGRELKTTTFSLPAVEVGSILEYRYQLRYSSRRSAPTWYIQQPFFVHEARYIFNPPAIYNPNSVGQAGVAGKRLTRQINGDNDMVVNSKLPPGNKMKQDGIGRWILDLTDIPPIPNETYTPPLESQIYRVEFYYTTSFVQKDYWQDVMKKWSKAVNEYTSPTDAIRHVVQEETAGIATPLEKAKRLYAFVQSLNNTDFTGSLTYAGINERMPSKAVDTVLEEKKGSSKRMALLYLSLSRAADISARPVRIASRDQRIFAADRLSTDQLDSILIAVNLDGKEILLDPAEKMAPFQTLHWSHAAAGGLAMDPSGKVETILTPEAEAKENKTVRVGTLAISDEGTVTGSLKVGFTGQRALEWRQISLRLDDAQLKARMESELARQAPAGVQLHIDHIAGMDPASPQVMAVVQISGTLGARNGNRLVLPRLFFESKETNPFPAETERQLPIDMHYASQEQDQITYTLPPGFTIQGPPQEVKFKWENNAAYQLNSKADAASLVSARLLARGFTMLDAKDYAPLRDFYTKVTTSDQEQFVLLPQSASNVN